MSLLSRIAKKIRRRFRRKGTAVGYTGRKPTAVDLWQRNFSVANPPAARAGTMRRRQREINERKARDRMYANG